MVVGTCGSGPVAVATGWGVGFVLGPGVTCSEVPGFRVLPAALESRDVP
jgi:hypothetical protein